MDRIDGIKSSDEEFAGNVSFFASCKNSGRKEKGKERISMPRIARKKARLSKDMRARARTTTSHSQRMCPGYTMPQGRHTQSGNSINKKAKMDKSGSTPSEDSRFCYLKKRERGREISIYFVRGFPSALMGCFSFTIGVLNLMMEKETRWKNSS